MACSITIDGVFGLGSGPSVIRVVGTVVDCPPEIDGNNLLIGISCTSADGPFMERSTQADASGNWQVLIPVVQASECRCNRPVFVRALCLTDPDCSAEFRVGELECKECPIITFPGPNGDDVFLSPVEVDCNPDGTASVTINFIISNTTSDFFYVILNPGPQGTLVSGGVIGILPGSSSSFTAVLQYPTPSAPQPFFEFFDIDLQPTGCPPIPVPVPPIEPCEPANCPVITDIVVEFLDCERDPADGLLKRKVRFMPTVVGPSPTAHNWSFGDGITKLGGGPPSQFEDHHYAAPPAFPPQLCITGPNTCGMTCLSVPLTGFEDLEPCQCPDIVSVSVTIGECERDSADQKLKRRVTFTPTFSGPPPSSHQWDFGDGTIDFGSGAPAQTDHFYEQKPTEGPELCIKGADPKCEQKCYQVPLSDFDAFQPCGVGPPLEEEEEESTGCGALRLVVVIAGALAMLAALLAICVPQAATVLLIIAGVFAIVALIAGLFYAIFCPKKPCNVGLLMTGQSTLGAGVAAIILSGCCPWMIWAGLVLAVAGLSTLLFWRSLCNKSTCTLAKEITKVVGGVVLPVIGIIVAIPILTACVSGFALAWVSAVFGPIAAYAASC